MRVDGHAEGPVHEQEVVIRWRDMDAYGHVNNGVYLNYLEEARDEWLERALGTAGNSWDYVLAHVAIDYLTELTQEDGAVVVRCALEGVGRSSLRMREEIATRAGRLVARAEAVLVAFDRRRRCSRVLRKAERAALEKELPRPARRSGAKP
jgi:acyl-CoA thioester hydrolase